MLSHFALSPVAAHASSDEPMRVCDLKEAEIEERVGAQYILPMLEKGPPFSRSELISLDFAIFCRRPVRKWIQDFSPNTSYEEVVQSINDERQRTKQRVDQAILNYNFPDSSALRLTTLRDLVGDDDLDLLTTEDYRELNLRFGMREQEFQHRHNRRLGCEETVDLSGGFPPPRDQSTSNWCVAYSTYDLAGFAKYGCGFKDKGFTPSYIDLQMRCKRDQVEANEIIARDRADTQRRQNLAHYSAFGGCTQQFGLAALKDQGACPETPESRQLAKDYLSLEQSLVSANLVSSPAFAAGQSTYQKSFFRQICEKEGSVGRQARSLRTFLVQGAFDFFESELGSCESRREDFSGMITRNIPVESGLRAAKEVLASLGSGHAVGIEADVSAFLQGVAGGHAMVIVGAGPSPVNGVCEVTLRNSWGAKCPSAPLYNDFRCDPKTGLITGPIMPLLARTLSLTSTTYIDRSKRSGLVDPGLKKENGVLQCPK